MNKTMKVLLNVIRLLFVIQLVVGILMWAGQGADWVNSHMAIGLLFVVLVVAFTAMGKARGAPATLAWVSILWGIVTIAVGVMQRHWMLNGSHWVVQLLHLLLGMGMQAQAERMARAVRSVPVAAPQP